MNKTEESVRRGGLEPRLWEGSSSIWSSRPKVGERRHPRRMCGVNSRIHPGMICSRENSPVRETVLPVVVDGERHTLSVWQFPREEPDSGSLPL